MEQGYPRGLTPRAPGRVAITFLLAAPLKTSEQMVAEMEELPPSYTPRIPKAITNILGAPVLQDESSEN